jgi:hypothetical protein
MWEPSKSRQSDSPQHINPILTVSDDYSDLRSEGSGVRTTATAGLVDLDVITATYCGRKGCDMEKANDVETLTNAKNFSRRMNVLF